MLSLFKYIFGQRSFILAALLAMLFSGVFIVDGFSQYANSQNDSLLALGNKVYRSGNYVESEKIYRKALADHSTNKSSNEWIIAAVGYGASLLDQGKYDSGAYWMFKADSAVSKDTPLELQAYVKSNVGWGTSWSQNERKAFPIYLQAHALAKASNDQYRIAQISSSISLLAHLFGDYSSAVNYAKIAVDNLTELGDDFLLSIALVNLHRVYNDLGFVDEAEEALLKSLSINTRNNSLDLLMSDYKDLGYFYQRKGDYDKALIYFAKHLDLASKLNKTLFIPGVNDAIGAVYFDLGEYKKALECFTLSEQLRVKYNYSSKPSTISQIALTNQKLGQFDLARSLFHEVLEAFEIKKDKHQIIETYLRLSELELASENISRAKSFSESALSLALESESKLLLARSYASLGTVNAQLSNFAVSVEQHKKAYSIASVFKGYRLADYSISLAKAFYELNSDSSFYYADIAFSEIEREQNNIYGDNLESGVFSEYAGFYNEVAFWYLQKYQNTEKAFEIAEQGKSRVLMKQLAFSDTDFLNDLDVSVQLSIRQKEKTIDKLYRALDFAPNLMEADSLKQQIRIAELDYQSFNNELRLRNKKYKSNRVSPIISLSDLQDKLSSRDAVIEFLITDHQLTSFWITRSKVTSYTKNFEEDQIVSEVLSEHVSRFRTALQNSASLNDLKTLSTPLYNLLILPFEKSFPNIDRLVIVPSHSLSVLPFDALYINNEFLLERFNIKYLPSASIYNLINNPTKKESDEILAVAGSGFSSASSANSTRSRSSYASLPSSLLEVDAISAEFQDHTILKNDAVTESSVKSLPLEKFRYLHFATHGAVNERNPMQSGLVLSEFDETDISLREDGYLNSLEISKLNLNSDLVVLSACNTAIGRLVNGEGLLGLQRSFFKAGASSVIVSLWSVYDRSTSVLMKEFYRNLNNYEESEISLWSRVKIYFDVYEPPMFGYKEKALRDAKLFLLDHPYYNHPVNWAPFILIGK